MSATDGLKALGRAHTYDPSRNACLRTGLILAAGGAAAALGVDRFLLPAGGPQSPLLVLVLVQFAVFGLAFGVMGTLRRDLDRRHDRDVTLLSELAMTDPLTGLRNRRYVEEELRNLLHRSGRTGGTISVVYFDLDHFREVNEKEGHPGGDRMLRKVADALRTVLRQGEILGRYGGDEFLLVVAADLPYATKLVDRAVTAVRQLARQSMSAGVARSRWDGTTSEELIAAADARLMRVKVVNRIDTNGSRKHEPSETPSAGIVPLDASGRNGSGPETGSGRRMKLT